MALLSSNSERFHLVCAVCAEPPTFKKTLHYSLETRPSPLAICSDCLFNRLLGTSRGGK